MSMGKVESMAKMHTPRVQDIHRTIRTLIAPHVFPGDVAVDATAGRGKDTLFLAELVGEQGKVFAFDIQEEAIEHTKQRLSEAKLLDRVTLLLADHAKMNEYVNVPVKLIMFNLGYLPGSDHKIITLPETTVAAIQNGLSILMPGGLIAVTVYRGHPGGKAEADAVNKFLAGLNPRYYSVLQGLYINRGEDTPYWMIVQKHREVDHEKP